MVIVPKDHRLKLKLCWKKRHRICTCRTASYGESRNILILVAEKRMSANASNRSRDSYKNYAITSAVGYFGFVVVMLWYQSSAQIPNKLNESSGVLSEERVGGKLMTKITNGEDVYWFTCASSLRGFSTCITKRKSSELLGRYASVFWYDQKIFPAIEQRKLVVLVVGGKEIISRAMSEERLASGKRNSFWICGVVGFFVLCVSAFFLKKARRS
jgi:uncharacterized membrane protein